MKDYYYTLGVSHQAALSDIQQAYKKLSLKFHPEKNGNDPFFVLHYNKIKEAYQILSDDHKRFRYDKAYKKQLAVELDDIIEAPTPIISAFFASKNTVQKGDIITISWEVLNAERIHISLIGEVSNNGTRTIRLTEPLPNEPYLYVDLEASNSNTPSSSKRLALKNVTYDPDLLSGMPLISLSEKKNEAVIPVAPVVQGNSTIDKNHKNKPVKKATKKKKPRIQKAPSTSSKGQENNAWIAYLLVIVLFFMIVVMLYTLFLINPIF